MIIAEDLLTDLDIVNCFPTLLNQIVRKEGMYCQALDDYVRHRDALIGQIMADTGLSRRVCKDAFITVLHNGQYISVTGGVKHHILDTFAEGVKSVVKNLAAKQAYAQVWTVAKRVAISDPTKQNPLGTFVSYVIQRVEAQVLACLKTFVEENVCQARLDVDMYDGGMFSGLTSLTDDNLQNLLERSAKFVHNQLQLEVRFEVKPVRSTADDLKSLHGDGFDQLTVCSRPP